MAKVSKHRALQCLPVITKAVSHNVKEKKKKEMVIPWDNHIYLPFNSILWWRCNPSGVFICIWNISSAFVMDSKSL